MGVFEIASYFGGSKTDVLKIDELKQVALDTEDYLYIQSLTKKEKKKETADV